MSGPCKQIKKRLLTILILFTILVFAVLMRVFWIQVVNGEWYEMKAFAQQNKNQIISPMRGMICDRNGKELAVSISVETVSVNPSQVRKQKMGIEQIAQKLSDVLQLDKAEVLKKLQKPGGYEVIKRKVDKKIGEVIKTWARESRIDGIYVDEDTKRYYPSNNLAAQVIGFTGVDNQGLYGVEKEMEKYLKGEPGKIMNEVDLGGREIPFENENEIEVKDGLNVVLTIDKNIQFFAENALQKAIDEYKVLDGGTAIVMDPRNGDILAMVSKPDFDLNNPYSPPDGVNGIEADSWTDLNQSEQVKALEETWKNRAVSITYEPGSTFKAITAAAGLEEGIISPDSEVVDLPVKVSGWTINCWYAGGHGKETFRESVYNSCNPVFVKLSQELGIEKFYSYVRDFGFYDKTGIDLPGESGSIIHKKPTEVDMATASFGQSFQVTPIQLITAYGAIANGGKLLKPHLLKELTDQQGNVVMKYEPETIRNAISKQTSSTLKDILEGVVSQGTGINAYVKGFRVAGKTGTSETAINGARSEDRYVASFSAFAPADNPVICVLVALDNPSLDSHAGSVVAGPVAGSIIDQTLDYLGVERRYTEKDRKEMAQEIYVPDVRNKSIAEAKKTLSASGFEVKIIGNGYDDNTIVVDQSPKSDISLPGKSIVILYTNKSDTEITVKMPYVINATIPEAMRTLNNAGLNIKIKGSGTAVKQEYEAGTVVPMGKAVEIEFWTIISDD